MNDTHHQLDTFPNDDINTTRALSLSTLSNDDINVLPLPTPPPPPPPTQCEAWQNAVHDEEDKDTTAESMKPTQEPDEEDGSTNNGTVDWRVIIKLDVQVGKTHLVDQFEWPLLPQTVKGELEVPSPEMFAKKICADMGLGGEFISTVAHAVREQLCFARLNFDEASKVSGGIGVVGVAVAVAVVVASHSHVLLNIILSMCRPMRLWFLLFACITLPNGSQRLKNLAMGKSNEGQRSRSERPGKECGFYLWKYFFDSEPYFTRKPLLLRNLFYSETTW